MYSTALFVVAFGLNVAIADVPVTAQPASCPEEKFTWGVLTKGSHPLDISKQKIQDIIANGPNVNCLDSNDKTLLMLVASRSQPSGDTDNERIEMLLQGGADPMLKNSIGKTAEDMARERNLLKNVKQLQMASPESKKALAEEKTRIEKERERYLERTKHFRLGIKAGDETTFGMVIEVKYPLAKVQTTQYVVSHYTEWTTKYNSYGSYKDPEAVSQTNSIPVEKWFKISDLYPAE
jgi:hypothetical protein